MFELGEEDADAEEDVLDESEEADDWLSVAADDDGEGLTFEEVGFCEEGAAEVVGTTDEVVGATDEEGTADEDGTTGGFEVEGTVGSVVVGCCDVSGSDELETGGADEEGGSTEGSAGLDACGRTSTTRCNSKTNVIQNVDRGCIIDTMLIEGEENAQIKRRG